MSNRFPTFRDENFFVDVSTLEDEATTFPRNVEIRWPIDAASRSRSTKSSATRLRKPQNLKTYPLHCVRFTDSLDKLWRNCTMEEAIVRNVFYVESLTISHSGQFTYICLASVAASHRYSEWHNIARRTVDQKHCLVTLSAVQSRCNRPSLCQTVSALHVRLSLYESCQDVVPP